MGQASALTSTSFFPILGSLICPAKTRMQEICYTCFLNFLFTSPMVLRLNMQPMVFSHPFVPIVVLLSKTFFIQAHQAFTLQVSEKVNPPILGTATCCLLVHQHFVKHNRPLHYKDPRRITFPAVVQP